MIPTLYIVINCDNIVFCIECCLNYKYGSKYESIIEHITFVQ
jgi:hypothetical protein